MITYKVLKSLGEKKGSDSGLSENLVCHTFELFITITMLHRSTVGYTKPVAIDDLLIDCFVSYLSLST